MCTVFSVNTKNFPAFKASPSNLFVPDKFSDTIFFYVTQIFKHAHTIFCTISFVKLFQAGTGESIALKTIFVIAFQSYFAILYSTSGTILRFILTVTIAPVT